MPHFFIESKNISQNLINIDDEALFNHLVRAMRVKIGETIMFIDENKIQYHAGIVDINKKSLSATILNSYRSFRELDIDITLARCVLKFEADGSAIQKATELGVKTIIPLISDNCAVKENVIIAKSDKFQKIADESVKQCERADFPVVCIPIRLDKFLDNLDYDVVLVFSEREKKVGIKDYFKHNPYKKGQRILIIIGPEGGFSEREFAIFDSLNLPQLTLGKLILRADTAVAAGVFGVVQEVSYVQS